MKSRVLFLIALIFFIIVSALIFLQYKNKYPGHTKISINNTVVYVEIADTDEKRTQGLSGKEKLGDDEGMLFIFPAKNKYPFWMKEMNFPLDFIWIEDDKVADVTQNVPAPEVGEALSSLPLYSPKKYVNKVLEVNAGYVQKKGIHIGDTVR